MKNVDLAVLMKRMLELLKPNLRSYYRMPVKGRVVKTYDSDGNYWADVQPTRNDESDDTDLPVIPKVEIPVMWGGPQRGVVCPIPKETRVVVTFFDGDPNYPFISQVRWYGNKAPSCEVNGFIIQMEPGCHIKIDAEKNILAITPANISRKAGENIDVVAGGDMRTNVAGDASSEIGGSMTISAGEELNMSAPDVEISAGEELNMSAPDVEISASNLSITATTQHTGKISIVGDVNVQGNINCTGAVMDTAGNSPHHSHP